MADFLPRVTLPTRFWGGVDVLDDNGATDYLKILRQADVAPLTPVVLDAANFDEVLVAPSGSLRSDVWAYTRQQTIARPDLRFGGKTLPNTFAFDGDVIQVSSGEMRVALGPDRYTGVVAIGDFLGWNGVSYVVELDPDKALLQTELAGTAGTDTIRCKVLPR